MTVVPEAHPTVLIVEDEPSFVEALMVGLKREGFRPQAVGNGNAALTSFEAIRPDVVLLDVMLPDRSGLDVCREIRRKSSVPIIMVSAKSSEIDTVVGLEMGSRRLCRQALSAPRAGRPYSGRPAPSSADSRAGRSRCMTSVTSISTPTVTKSA